MHDCDARVKIAVTVAFAFSVTLVPEGRWAAFAALGVLWLTVAVISRIRARFFLLRAGLALPFVAAAIPLVFTRPGETVFTVPLAGWTASSDGIIALTSIVLKSTLAVLMATVLVGTTSPTQLIRGLERLHVPRLLSSTIMLMYRYLFVIADEGQRMLRARDSRSARVPGREAGGSVIWRAGILGRMVGSLFLRSYERSERVHAAMLARGYDGTFRTIRQETAPGPWEWAALIGMMGAMSGIVIYVQL